MNKELLKKWILKAMTMRSSYSATECKIQHFF